MTDGLIERRTAEILEKVRTGGDMALQELTLALDQVDLDTLRVSEDQIKKAYDLVQKENIEDLEYAAEQIRLFARKQLECLKPLEYESQPGVALGHRLIPVQSVGAYVPGGRYPLPSSALMSVIPAKEAGVKRVVACSPPHSSHQGIHPLVLVAVDIAGADEVYCLGGAQAIAALAYGTESILPVDLIVGPGNRYVTEAKRQVSGRVGIDMLAGPSEVMILADETAVPRFIALDLLAQCEHDPTAKGSLVTTSRELALAVQEMIHQEAKELGTGREAYKTWEENGEIVVVADWEEGVEYANRQAPEHLELHTRHNEELFEELVNYGSVFLGPYSPVSFGDYVSGPNHILPTLGGARFSNGLWVGTFIKVVPFQRISREGAAAFAGCCSRLARAEGLFVHGRAAEVRLEHHSE